VFFLVFLIMVVFYISSWSSNCGTTSAQFLKLEAGARPVGMGGAFTAVCDDVQALYWNTAGLAQIKSKEL